jgi:probable F420-dependent oxidoreductase
MADFGIVTVCTHYTIQPGELGLWCENNGFESLWYGEHSHIPTSRKSPFPMGGELPQFYKEFFDPFIGLTAAAAATTKLKVGTSVCLVPEHNAINLAKTIACVDRISNGRFILGIGAGWNVEEMADHGVELKNRWKITRESVLAMREIWTKEVAEYHGDFVKFDPMWCWPKPIQAGGPPILMGASSKWVPKRVAEYCDGWFPIDASSTGNGASADLASGIAAIKAEAAKLGRPTDKLDFTALTAFDIAPPGGLEARIPELIELGFNRILFMSPVAVPEKQWRVLERYATLIRKFI